MVCQHGVYGATVCSCVCVCVLVCVCVCVCTFNTLAAGSWKHTFNTLVYVQTHSTPHRHSDSEVELESGPGGRRRAWQEEEENGKKEEEEEVQSARGEGRGIYSQPSIANE